MANNLRERVKKASAYSSVMAHKYLVAQQKLEILSPLLGSGLID